MVRGHPQDVSMGRPKVLHRGPYGNVLTTSFWDILRTSSGRNFTEWEATLKITTSLYQKICDRDLILVKLQAYNMFLRYL